MNAKVATSCALAVLVGLLAVEEAVAGGGGAKRKSKITVENATAAPIGVILNKTQADLQAIANDPNPQDRFRREGGKIINMGNERRFKDLRAGDHTVWAVDNPTGANVTRKEVHLAKGENRSLRVVTDPTTGNLRIE